MAVIRLGGRGGVVRGWVVVDDADFAELSRYRWCLSSAGYAIRNVREGERRRSVLMHRQIMGLEPGDPREVDHRDLDRLNCQRENLRVVTHAQNGQNRLSQRGSGSRHRGVSWRPDIRRWRVDVRAGEERRYEYRDTEEEAAERARALRAEMMTHSEI